MSENQNPKPMQRLMNLFVPIKEKGGPLPIHHLRVNNTVWDAPTEFDDILIPPGGSLIVEIHSNGQLTVDRK